MVMGLGLFELIYRYNIIDHSIELDKNISLYVLVPIVVVMMLVSILRGNLQTLMKPEPKDSLRSIQERQTVLRSQRLRTFGNFLSFGGFQLRKAFFLSPEDGVLCITKEGGSTNPLASMNNAMDPGNMKSMLLGNLTMILPQIGMLGWINLIFSGFILIKLPFPLTLRFKGLLQRGIELTALNPSYVSSLSFYFLTLLGLKGVLTLIMGAGNTIDDTAMMKAQTGGGSPLPTSGPQIDFTERYKNEAENLALFEYSPNEISKAPERLQKRLKNSTMKRKPPPLSKRKLK